MKRLLPCFMALILVLLGCTSCLKPTDGGIPFLSTKPNTTAAPNTVMVTFPEGFTVLQIAERLEEKGVCSADEFITACKTPYDGIEIDNPDERIILLEGYIFPDTYEFYFDSDVNTVLRKFISNYNAKVTDEMKNRAKELGYTMDEMLTLASVIQKECDEGISECANVSSVFHNRLKSPAFSLLQSDVTSFYIKYSMGDYLGGYQKDTKLENQNDDIQRYMKLYSTYYCKGLPAGPICNPGIKAINAALNPSDTNYYYFFTDSTLKNFYYSETFAEHVKKGKEVGVIK